MLIKSCLRNEKKEYNIKGIFNNNIIKFLDFDTIMIINLNKNTIERIKDNQKIKINIDNQECYIENNNLKTCFNIKVLKYENINNYFYIKYLIENNSFEFEIKII